MQANPFQTVGEHAPMTSAPSDFPEVAEHTLRRSGRRPLYFRGRELANVMSYRVGTPLWYELNVFQVEDGRMVADVRMFTKCADDKDRFTVFVGHSFDEIATFFENYTPAQDVRADLVLDDENASFADLTFQALGLRARVIAAEQQYQALVTELFADLETTLGSQVVEMHTAA